MAALLLLIGCDSSGKAGDKCSQHTDCGAGLVCGGDQTCRSAVAAPSSTASGTASAAGSGAPATVAKVPLCYPEEICKPGDFEGCTKLCDGGKALACRVLSRWYGFDPTTRDQHDEDKTKQYQQKQVALDEAGCKKKDACACGRLVDNFSKGHGVERDAKSTVARGKLACEYGDPATCETLGDIYLNGFPVDVGKDPGAAKKYYQRAFDLRKQGCDAENLAHCAFLGRLYEGGVGVDASADKAISLARRACEGGEGLGCSLLGLWYRQGRPGIPKNPRAARDAYQQACKQGRPEFCREAKAVEAESPAG
ncbi:MAG: sel1 repeat family protein [Deltaproteobacteria bacterium]|jgi:TPR repeat protein|nr:sel1 repeat family protein [Deltaproteobacteria bacterium]MBW2530542.1 sel1 repeat family protein [Deltaproteobacteria bacterium]